MRLLKHFVAGITAHATGEIVGVQANTAINFDMRLRCLIVRNLHSYELRDEVEADESYFGGVRKGKRGRGAAGMIDADSLGNFQTCPMSLLHNQRPLCIVKTGDTFADIRACNGDFEDWIVDSDTAKKCPVIIWDPRNGSAGPPAESISGAVITRSHAMVTNRQRWMEQTAAWMRQLVEA